MLFITTNHKAFCGVIMPAGISRIEVRGFNSSYFLSMYRLNAMAALRAVIIHIITNKNFQAKTLYNIDFEISPSDIHLQPKAKPIMANGIAKIVCENFTNDR